MKNENKIEKWKNVPSCVKSYKYGCKNCLWNGVECSHGTKYDPKDNDKNGCKNYAYYD